MWREALAIAKKDLLIEFKSRVITLQVIPILGSLFIIFGFAIGPDNEKLAQVAAGLIWISVLLMAILIAQRNFAIEEKNEAKENFQILGFDPSSIFLGKAIVLFSELFVVTIAAFLSAIFFSSTLLITLQIFLVLISAILVMLCLSFLSAMFGAVSVLSSSKETMLSLLFLPACAPIILSATKITEVLFVQREHFDVIWMGLLAFLAIVYFIFGILTFELITEES